MLAKKNAQPKDSTDKKMVRTSVTWEPDNLNNGKTIAKLIGYRHSFSAYVNELVRKDVEWRTTGRNERLKELASV